MGKYATYRRRGAAKTMVVVLPPPPKPGLYIDDSVLIQETNNLNWADGLLRLYFRAIPGDPWTMLQEVPAAEVWPWSPIGELPLGQYQATEVGNGSQCEGESIPSDINQNPP